METAAWILVFLITLYGALEAGRELLSDQPDDPTKE